MVCAKGTLISTKGHFAMKVLLGNANIVLDLNALQVTCFGLSVLDTPTPRCTYLSRLSPLFCGYVTLKAWLRSVQICAANRFHNQGPL